MANDLTNIMAQILARAMLILRARNSMPQLVNSDFSTDAAKKGQTIDIPTYETDASVTDVTPSPTEDAFVTSTPGLVQITMSEWKKVNFNLTDKELVEIEANAVFVPQELQRAIEALARYVNQQIFANYKGIYGFYGTPGSTPFSDDTTLAATQSRMLLNIQKCPDDGRRFGVLDPIAEASALELSAFQQADKAGTNLTILQGLIGQKFGTNWVWDHDVPYHTAGTLVNATVTGANTAPTAGTRTDSVSISTGAGGSASFNEGDIIEIAGHNYTYVVTAGPGIGGVAALGESSSGTITIAPGLRSDTVGGEDITIKASHRVNLHMHREAIGLAWRPLLQNTVDFTGGNQMMTMQDPQTGLVLRLEVKRANKAVIWEIDCLFGSKLVRPQFAVRIAG